MINIRPPATPLSRLIWRNLESRMPQMLDSVETVLSLLAGSNDNERLAIVHRNTAGDSQIELRQQTWGEGVGWFTQSSVAVEPHQLPSLRAALGGSTETAVRPAIAAKVHQSPSRNRPELRIARAESA